MGSYSDKYIRSVGGPLEPLVLKQREHIGELQRKLTFAEKQVRDIATENARLKKQINELQSVR